jgi:hypothetical protein
MKTGRILLSRNKKDEARTVIPQNGMIPKNPAPDCALGDCPAPGTKMRIFD